MGHRATYVLIEDGTTATYYSHWGAKVVPAVVLGGFAATRAYLRALAPADGLLDTVWAEGGILLDGSTHTLLFWGGELLRDRPDLRRLFLPSVRLRWPGWIVAWATHGVVDFAAHPGVAQALGQDSASLLHDNLMEWTTYAEVEIRAPAEDPWIATVLTVRWEDGKVSDYTLGYEPQGYLTFGPDLLAILRGSATGALPRENGDAKDGPPMGGAYADVPARVLWVWQDSTRHPAFVEHLRTAWPGWQVEELIDGLAQQVALTGRDPALVAAPRDQEIAELLGEVTWGDDWDPGALVQRTISPTERETATIQFAPGFYRVDRAAMTPAERCALLQQLLQRVTGVTGEQAPDTL
jgi:hypothetical protein